MSLQLQSAPPSLRVPPPLYVAPLQVFSGVYVFSVQFVLCALPLTRRSISDAALFMISMI